MMCPAFRRTRRAGGLIAVACAQAVNGCDQFLVIEWLSEDRVGHDGALVVPRIARLSGHKDVTLFHVEFRNQ